MTAVIMVYSAYCLGMVTVGLVTTAILKYMKIREERRESKRLSAVHRRKENHRF